MSTVTQEKSLGEKMYIVNSLITLGIMFGSWFLPPIGQITPLGMKVAGTFIGVIYGWTTVGLIWPSLAGLIALGLTGYNTLPALFTAGFGHNITLFIFLFLILIAIIDRAGVTKYIAIKMLKVKFANGRPWVIMFLFIMVSYLISAFLNTIGAILICWSIFYGVCEEVGYTKKDKFPRLILLGIIFGSIMGQYLMPFQVGYMVFYGVAKQLTGLTVNSAVYTPFAFVFEMISILLYMLICKIVFRPDVSALRKFDVNTLETIRLTRYQKWVFVYFSCLVVALMIPAFFPKSWALTQLFITIGNTGITAMFLAIAVAMRFEGKPFIDIVECVHTGVSWEIVFLFVAVYPLADALTADGIGVTETMASFLGPMLDGKGAFMFIMLIMLFCVVVTNFIHNTVTGLMVMPVMASLTVQVGADPLLITLFMIHGLSAAFLTPAASPQATLGHSNTNWLTKKDMLEFTIISVFLALFVTAVMIPIGSMFNFAA